MTETNTTPMIEFAMIIIAFILFLLGLVIALVAWAGRTIWGTVVGGILMLPFVATLLWELSLPEVDWNPLIRDDSAIVGMYADADKSLTLKLDKTFVYRTDSQQMEGTWQHDDYNLLLNAPGEPTYKRMRFIRSGGAYYVLTEEPEDLDMWDGDLGLEKISQENTTH